MQKNSAKTVMRTWLALFGDFKLNVIKLDWEKEMLAFMWETLQEMCVESRGTWLDLLAI